MYKSILTVIIALTSIFSSFGQSSQESVIQDVYQKINEGKTSEAIDDINEVLEQDPDNFSALNALGLAYRKSEAYDLSAEAYQKAHSAQPQNLRGMFNLGVAYALVNKLDSAFKILMQLKDSNKFNITNIGLSPAAKALKSDARYKLLFPSSEEYSYPFLEEEVDIIYDWKGENQGDQFGWIARNIGDVNGDGVMDFTSSAPTYYSEYASVGKIYVYSGKSGELIWSYAGRDENGQLGMSVESAGDVNGDGIPDVVAGAPYSNRVLVFSGNDGRIIYNWQGNDAKGAFGRGVKGVGDVNGDGYGDVLIGEPFQIWGAPLNSDQIENAGITYLYSGKDGSIIKKWEGSRIGDGFGTALSGKTTNGETLIMIGSPSAGDSNRGQVSIYKNIQTKPYFIIEADSTGSDLGGMFMSIVGDVNGDGVQDVYASDFSDTAFGNATGKAYAYSGVDGSQLFKFTGEVAGDGFGIGVADAGDINKDGYDDLVIGAWQHASAAPSGGKVYIYSGKEGALMRTLTGKVVGETLGFDTTGIGDVNGDGIVDLLLTSAWSAINGSQSGRVLIVAGK